MNYFVLTLVFVIQSVIFASTLNSNNLQKFKDDGDNSTDAECDTCLTGMDLVHYILSDPYWVDTYLIAAKQLCESIPPKKTLGGNLSQPRRDGAGPPPSLRKLGGDPPRGLARENFRAPQGKTKVKGTPCQKKMGVPPTFWGLKNIYGGPPKNLLRGGGAPPPKRVPNYFPPTKKIFSRGIPPPPPIFPKKNFFLGEKIIFFLFWVAPTKKKKRAPPTKKKRGPLL
uniref:SJCHGC06927 protein n=1 Tax=Schistosoma japonicum TaxID=6182 RepID=Q5DAT9_SCHJA|nr:SJCHGC06927 protein [Schistosoma japonicum]